MTALQRCLINLKQIVLLILKHLGLEIAEQPAKKAKFKLVAKPEEFKK
jgi:hypothetical protein